MMNKGVVFPETLEHLLIERSLGAERAEKATNARLPKREFEGIARAVIELSDASDASAAPYKGRDAELFRRAAQLVYMVPRAFAELRAVLAEMEGLFSGRAEVSMLQLGDGLDGPLAFLDFAARSLGAKAANISVMGSDSQTQKDIHGLAAMYGEALRGEGFRIHPRIDTASVDLQTASAPRARYDIILLNRALGALWQDNDADKRKRVGYIAALADSLEDGGCIVIIEPSARSGSRELQALRNIAVERHGLNIFAPCLRQGPCPMLDEGREAEWCFSETLWARPKFVRKLDQFLERKSFAPAFSYVVVSKQSASPVQTVQGAHLFRAVGGLIQEKGKFRAYLCGEVGCVMTTLLKRHSKGDARSFRSLRRGDIMAIDDWEKKNDGLRLHDSSRVEILREFSPQEKPS